MGKKIVNWLGNIAFLVFLMITIAIILSLLLSKNQQGQPPSIFGYKIMTVLSGSMDPLLEPGDIIFVNVIDRYQVKVNDVITYQKGQQTFVTHRVVDIVTNGGDRSFQTKGDANNINDQELVSPNQLVGTLKYHIPKVGYVTNVFNSTWGLFLIGGVILVFFLIKRVKFISIKKQV
ncbi:signal peptidase I [Bacillus sp. 1P02SD]|uniref:signal peptidase I n=1 Tax=Bacillus sp. 1P02SD TaxID=3132264 RepID=UPI00399F0150